MIKLQSRAIKVALMLQGDINTQMSKGVNKMQPLTFKSKETGSKSFIHKNRKTKSLSTQ